MFHWDHYTFVNVIPIQYYNIIMCKWHIILFHILTDNGHHNQEQEQTKLTSSTDSIMVQSHSNLEGQMEVMKAHPMQVAGSRLPDCTHACGSCTPCRLVMVSFVCSSLTGAETCPISYRCMCNGKSYPVP